jgi:hypothetical protein
MSANQSMRLSPKQALVAMEEPGPTARYGHIILGNAYLRELLSVLNQLHRIAEAEVAALPQSRLCVHHALPYLGVGSIGFERRPLS